MINQFKISMMIIKKNIKIYKKNNKVCWKSRKKIQFLKARKGNVQITLWLVYMAAGQALMSLRMVYHHGCRPKGLVAGRGSSLDFLDLSQSYLLLLLSEFSFFWQDFFHW